MARIAASDTDNLPHNLEAEQSVIGSILIDPDAMFRVREIGLEARDFWKESNAAIYRAAMRLAERYEDVDLVTLSDELGTELKEVGGAAELTAMISCTPTSIHAEHYAKIVRQHAQRRRLISVAGDIAQLAQEHDNGVGDLYAEATQKLLDSIDTSDQDSHLYGTDEGLEQYLANQEARRERLEQNPDSLLVTGLTDLDAILGDMREGQLQVVGARTSVGKTMWLEQVAEVNARRGHRIAYYHLELSHQSMLDRRMARLSSVPVNQLREGYTGPELDRATEALRTWHQNIVYVHCPGWSAEQIVGDIRRMHARGECELAIVDYLGKIAFSDKHYATSEAYLIQAQVEALKSCAERLGIPVVLASQVSRYYKSRGSKRPHANDLRGSGAIENRANQIVMLHNPVPIEERDMAAEAETLEVHVEKNTEGATGMIEVVHLVGRFMLVDKERNHEPEDIPF